MKLLIINLKSRYYYISFSTRTQGNISKEISKNILQKMLRLFIGTTDKKIFGQI